MCSSHHLNCSRWQVTDENCKNHKMTRSVITFYDRRLLLNAVAVLWSFPGKFLTGQYWCGDCFWMISNLTRYAFLLQPLKMRWTVLPKCVRKFCAVIIGRPPILYVHWLKCTWAHPVDTTGMVGQRFFRMCGLCWSILYIRYWSTLYTSDTGPPCTNDPHCWPTLYTSVILAHPV